MAEAGTSTRGRIPFRADIEGLRGIATLWVLAYHAGVPLAAGGYVGLDIFFVMSGFLITALLVREAESTGRIALGTFFARRIRRLLPSTVAVLIAVVAVGSLIMDPLQREDLAKDVIAAGLYVVNWRYVDQQTDYLAIGLDASPVQHFWSLAVEEQFYVLWPLVIVGALWFAARRGHGLRLVGLIGALTIGALLFIYSLDHTREAAGAAYFSTLSRGWEFAVGCAIALIPFGRVRLSRAVSGTMVVGAMAAIIWCTLTFDATTRFPGPMALIPVLATAAIIVAGIAHSDGGPARALATRPARYVGRISYSWYLWHWPVLVFAAVLWGELAWPVQVALVGASLVPTLLAHRHIEERFRHPRSAAARRPRRAFALAGACTAVVALVGVASYATIPTVPVASAADAPGAKVVLDGRYEGPQRSARAIRPEPRSAVRDRGRADHDGCLVDQRATRSGPCIYGDRRGAATMVLLGDSHAMQYFPALDAVARQRGWRLIVLTKSGCTPADAAMYNGQFRRRYSECETWRGRALQRIARERASLVVVGSAQTHAIMEGGRRLDREPAAAAQEAGLIRTLTRLRATGARVIQLGANPRPDLDVRACVSRSLTRLERCAFERSVAYGGRRVNRNAARAVAGVGFIDIRPVMCPRRRCPAVIGNVLVYRNTAHITATYITTLTPWFAQRLPATLPRR